MNNLKVKTKLALLVLAFAIGLALFGLMARRTLETVKVGGPYYTRILQGEHIIADVLPPPMYIIESYLLVLQMENKQNRGRLDEFKARSTALRAEYNTRHENWTSKEPIVDETLRNALLSESYAPAQEFFKIRDGQFIPAVDRGDYALAQRLARGPLRASYDTHRAAVDRVVARATEQNKLGVAEAEQAVNRGTLLLWILGAGIIGLAGLGLGWALGRSISAMLNRTVNALSSTSAQIAATISQHERTAMHQAAAVNQTTATMDELEASFSQTAEMARSAADTAREAVSVADDGLQSVKQTLNGMNGLKAKVGVVGDQILRLSEQTGQIGSISNLVSDLANQTNLLALNAAVEAARAGEHGRGFGVVAAEIRKLADESKKSAERISHLVDEIQRATNSTVMATEESNRTVEQSIMLTQNTAQAFNMVSASSNATYEAAQQTLLSVPQQVTAVKQVLTSMEALNTGARETADGIGQTKIGIDTLRDATLKLKEML